MFTIANVKGHGLQFLMGAGDPAICGPAAGNSCTQFPLYRAFMALVALFMLGVLWLLLTRTRIGLIIQAALTHPDMAQALGHNVPRVMMGVFGGGCALAGLAGVIGGNAFVTEPNMAASVGAIIFVVVVVGGMGSLAGAFLASLLIGLLQTFAVVADVSVASFMQSHGQTVNFEHWSYPLLKITVSQMAPILPYLLLAHPQARTTGTGDKTAGRWLRPPATPCGCTGRRAARRACRGTPPRHGPSRSSAVRCPVQW